jgi:hypothetical protein
MICNKNDNNIILFLLIQYCCFLRRLLELAVQNAAIYDTTYSLILPEIFYKKALYKMERGSFFGQAILGICYEGK